MAASSFAVAVNGAATCGRRKRKRGDEVEEGTEGVQMVEEGRRGAGLELFAREGQPYQRRLAPPPSAASGDGV